MYTYQLSDIWWNTLFSLGTVLYLLAVYKVQTPWDK